MSSIASVSLSFWSRTSDRHVPNESACPTAAGTDCEMTADGLLAFRPARAANVLFHDCPSPHEAARHLRPTFEIDTGHSSFLSSPARVARIINAVARGELPPGGPNRPSGQVPASPVAATDLTK